MTVFPRIVAIVGETATGKTEIGEAVAAEIGGEVVCADSRQVFAELDVGTGKPDPQTLRQRPHHLFDALHLGDTASAGWYAGAAREVCLNIQARGATPVFVGGSGLYLEAALRGVASAPPSNAVIRDALRAEVAAAGPEALHRRLAREDPETAARVAPRDAQRIIRAMEVLNTSGQPLSWWHRQPHTSPVEGEWLAFQITCPLGALRARIEHRTAWMYDCGLVEETRALLASERASALLALNAIGYDEVASWETGKLGREEAVARTTLRTIQLAKRQRTWFRNRGGAGPVPAEAALTTILQAFRSP